MSTETQKTPCAYPERSCKDPSHDHRPDPCFVGCEHDNTRNATDAEVERLTRERDAARADNEAARRLIATLNLKLDETHLHRCRKCEQTVTEPTAQRQALEEKVAHLESELGRERVARAEAERARDRWAEAHEKTTAHYGGVLAHWEQHIIREKTRADAAEAALAKVTAERDEVAAQVVDHDGYRWQDRATAAEVREKALRELIAEARAHLVANHGERALAVLAALAPPAAEVPRGAEAGWTCPVMEGCVRKEPHDAKSWHAAADVPKPAVLCGDALGGERCGRSAGHEGRHAVAGSGIWWPNSAPAPEKPEPECTHARLDMAKPCGACPPGTKFAEEVRCPCGGHGCLGPDDNERHQCGGPREACCVRGCRECAPPPTEDKRPTTRVVTDNTAKNTEPICTGAYDREGDTFTHDVFTPCPRHDYTLKPRRSAVCTAHVSASGESVHTGPCPKCDGGGR